MGLTKAELEALNDSSFPNNNGGLITPQILRDYNDAAIANTVNQDDYTADSASFNSRILAATGSVTSAITGSSLITASISGQTMTFTKGDGTTFGLLIPDVSGSTISTGSLVTTASFNSYTQSTDSRLNNIESTTASLLVETQNLELFSASALVSISNLNASSASQQVSIDNLNTTTASLLIETQNLELFSASALTSLSNLNTATSSLFTSASLALTTASVSGQIMTFRKGDGTTFDVTLPAGSGSSLPAGVLSSSVTNFVDYSASVDSRINGIVTGTGFATTGSNTFTGDQTLIDSAGNFFTISDASGSLMLIPKGFTSASLHLSASISGSGNVIFKTNNNTVDTIISGSGNIFVNPSTPLGGFKRYIGGVNNIFNTVGAPQISSSMGFSPAMNGNIGAGAYTFRGPVSSSAWNMNNNLSLGVVSLGSSAVLNAEKLTGGLNLSSNVIQGTVSIIANQSALTGSNTALLNNSINGAVTVALSSSAASLSNNVINDSAFTLTNQFYSSSVGLGVLNMNRNNIGGQTNSIIVTGSQPTGTTTATSISDNLVYGGNNTLYVDIANARVSGATTYHNLLRTSVLGNGLIVSGSSLSTDTNSFGSAFVGRWNAVDSIRNKTSDIVFAVGTGTSTTRKTGFLIDSGSNSYFEGTVNISGSLSVNGSPLAGISTGSFATTGSNAFFGNQIISGNIGIRGNTTFTSVSGDQSSIILGSDTLGSSTGGSINVAIGNSAMKNASGSSQNVAIGNRALFKTTGSFNIAIGSETMTENTTGNNNVAIGLNALNLNTVGSENFALGGNSMQFTSGSGASFNIGIGANTLTRNQTDSQIAIGANALQYATTGNANTAIGRAALQDTTIGIDNVAIGTNALLTNVNGNRNTAVGKDSLRNVATNASFNVAIGYNALYDVETSENTAIGTSAFRQLISGSDNLGVGYLSGYDVINGNFNTLIGSNLRGQSAWDSVVAISNGLGDAGIKFFNSGSRTTITNNTLISGSLTTTGSLTIQSGSSFFANGNKQFNVGAFQSDVTQSGSANVSQSMNFEVTDISEGVTIASNSRITLANSGTYNIQFSAQIDRVSGSGIDEVHIWLKKNGTNVSASSGVVTLSGGAAEAKTIAAWNYVVNAAANDYYELVWEPTDSNIQLINQPATGNIPSTPSIILTVTQVR